MQQIYIKYSDVFEYGTINTSHLLHFVYQYRALAKIVPLLIMELTKVVTIFLIHLLLNIQLLTCDQVLNDTIAYYTQIVSEGIEAANHYKLPRDASMYEVDENCQIENFGDFDFIVVGAGSAGATLAGRLSEILEWKILILEAGDYGNDLVDIPGMSSFTPNYNWGFESIPQRTCCLGMKDRKCPYPRGKGVGGTSLINGLRYNRGFKGSFDDWNSQGNPGWSYDEVLPYFIKSEDANIPDGDPGYHGVGGPLHVEYHVPNSPQLYTFLEANKQVGRKVVDYNGKSQLGVSVAQIMNRNGRREDTGKIFLKPKLDQPNLLIKTNTLVTKVLIDAREKRAKGVLFNLNGRKYNAFASKEVIISCGTLQSPHLLQLSGLGHRHVLKKLKIPLIRELAVGDNLQDHSAFLGLLFTMNYQEQTLKISDYVKEFLNGTGPYTISGNNQGFAHLQTHYPNLEGVPDIGLVIQPSKDTQGSGHSYSYTQTTLDSLWGNLDELSTFQIYVILQKPKSSGTVRPKSSNPLEYPLIDSNLLTHPEDMERLYEGIQNVLQLMGTEAFSKANVTMHPPQLPACSKFKLLSRKYWYCTIRQLTMGCFHPVGTCKMGPEPTKGAVVNNELKVHGIDKLRVVDASIFPNAIGGYPNAVGIMIAEKIADLIKREYFRN